MTPLPKESVRKVAIVTGGASGIGRAAALALAGQGVSVAVADIDESGGKETASQIAALGQQAIYVHTDVTQDADCAHLVAAALAQYGRLDMAFNNAGIVGYPLLTADYGLSNWQRVIDINLTGVFNCMTHELKAMKQSGGAIVNTASIMALIGAVGGSAYCAAKHGVIGLTKAAALEYGRNGIRVNAICPGYVASEMTIGKRALFNQKQLQTGIDKTALKRLATPEEIAEIVVWLCSEKAAYVTGASYTIDGGFTAGC